MGKKVKFDIFLYETWSEIYILCKTPLWTLRLETMWFEHGDFLLARNIWLTSFEFFCRGMLKFIFWRRCWNTAERHNISLLHSYDLEAALCSLGNFGFRTTPITSPSLTVFHLFYWWQTNSSWRTPLTLFSCSFAYWSLLQSHPCRDVKTHEFETWRASLVS